MKTVLYVVMGDDEADPLAEIQMSDPRVLPIVGDTVDFGEGEAGFTGRVVRRVFRFMPYHVEVEVGVEPLG